MKQKSKFILLFGSTGLSGFHIANRLISEGYIVRAFCRSKQKLTRLFGQREIGFQNIIEGNVKNLEDISRAFERSEHYGNITEVINTIGSVPWQKQKDIQYIEYISHINIIQECKKSKVNKYVIISAALIERPWNPITVILNTICPNAFHYKQLCENHLRCSGLDYSIVRPPQLVGEIGDETLTDYEIDQGDRVMGKISRYTLAKVVVDSLKASNIGNKITFECTGAKEKTERTVEFGELKEDEKNKVIKVGHIGAKRTYGLVLTTLLIYLGYLILNKCGYIK